MSIYNVSNILSQQQGLPGLGVFNNTSRRTVIDPESVTRMYNETKMQLDREYLSKSPYQLRKMLPKLLECCLARNIRGEDSVVDKTAISSWWFSGETPSVIAKTMAVLKAPNINVINPLEFDPIQYRDAIDAIEKQYITCFNRTFSLYRTPAPALGGKRNKTNKRQINRKSSRNKSSRNKRK